MEAVRRRGTAWVTLALVVSASAGFVAPAAEAAKAKKVSIKMKSSLASTSLSGTFSGSPLGSGKLKGNANLPYFTITFSGKGGTATLKLKGAPSGNKIVGTWHWLRGTGKFKGIAGSGKATGTTAGTFTFTGTARY